MTVPPESLTEYGKYVQRRVHEYPLWLRGIIIGYYAQPTLYSRWRAGIRERPPVTYVASKIASKTPAYVKRMLGYRIQSITRPTVLRSAVERGVKKPFEAVEKGEKKVWEATRPYRMQIGKGIGTAQKEAGTGIRTIQAVESGIAQIPVLGGFSRVTKRYEKGTIGLSSWLSPTAGLELGKGFLKGVSDVNEVHPLRDISKGEELYAKRIVEPISTFIEGEKIKQQKEAKLSGIQPARQFGAGFVGTIVSIPSWFVFTIPKVAAESIIKPSAIPERAYGYGKGMYEFAKAKPFEFAGSVAAMAIAPRIIRRVEPYAARLSPRNVPIEKIARTGVIEKGVPSTVRVPVSTPIEAIKRRLENPKYKLTGRAEEVWHAAPTRWAPSIRGEIIARAGGSPTRGIYVAPEVYPKFAGLSAIIEAPRASVRPIRPTFYSLLTEGIEIPKRARVGIKEIEEARRLIGSRAPDFESIKKFAGYKKWVEEIAQKGKAEITPEVTAKIPWKGALEVEAVIPYGTRMVEPFWSRLLPRYTYVKAPRYRMTRVGRGALKELQREWKGELERAKLSGMEVRKLERLRSKELQGIKLSEVKKATLKRLSNKLKRQREIEKQYLNREVKLLNELRAKGELQETGYEPVKVELRHLGIRAEGAIPGEAISDISFRERRGGIGRIEEIERFRAGEYVLKRPERGLRFLPDVSLFRLIRIKQLPYKRFTGTGIDISRGYRLVSGIKPPRGVNLYDNRGVDRILRAYKRETDKYQKALRREPIKRAVRHPLFNLSGRLSPYMEKPFEYRRYPIEETQRYYLPAVERSWAREMRRLPPTTRGESLIFPPIIIEPQAIIKPPSEKKIKKRKRRKYRRPAYGWRVISPVAGVKAIFGISPEQLWGKEAKRLLGSQFEILTPKKGK